MSPTPVPGSTPAMDAPDSSRNLAKAPASAPAPAPSSKRDYKGFVAGVFSGIAKLSGEFVWPLAC